MSNEMREPRNNASELFSKLMPVESKAQPGAREHVLEMMAKGRQRMQTVSIEDDKATLDKVKCTFPILGISSLGAFYATVGITPGQVAMLTKDELMSRALQAKEREQEVAAPKSRWQTTQPSVPQRVFMV